MNKDDALRLLGVVADLIGRLTTLALPSHYV